jgi:ACR3 family arsenite efflux pump ArsB
VAAIYVQIGKGDDGEDAPMTPRVVLVVVDVAVQMLLYSATGAVFVAVIAYGPQIRACGGGGHFCDQVHRSKTISLAASVSAVVAAVAKDVVLPFSVWPNPSP